MLRIRAARHASGSGNSVKQIRWKHPQRPRVQGALMPHRTRSEAWRRKGKNVSWKDSPKVHQTEKHRNQPIRSLREVSSFRLRRPSDRRCLHFGRTKTVKNPKGGPLAASIPNRRASERVLALGWVNLRSGLWFRSNHPQAETVEQVDGIVESACPDRRSGLTHRTLR